MEDDVIYSTLFKQSPHRSTITVGYSPRGRVVLVELRCHDIFDRLLCLESKGWSDSPPNADLRRWVDAWMTSHIQDHTAPF